MSTPSQGAQENSALTKIRDNTGYLRDGPGQPLDSEDHHGAALAGVVQQGRQARPGGVRRTREFVGEDMAGFDPPGGQSGELRIEILAQRTPLRVPEIRRHNSTVSLPSDIEDLRHAVSDKQ